MDWRQVYINALAQMFEDFGSRMSYRVALVIAARLYHRGFLDGRANERMVAAVGPDRGPPDELVIVP